MSGQSERMDGSPKLEWESRRQGGLGLEDIGAVKVHGFSHDFSDVRNKSTVYCWVIERSFVVSINAMLHLFALWSCVQFHIICPKYGRKMKLNRMVRQLTG